MKKQYNKPRVIVEEFQPQTYVAACYSIKCVSPNGNASCSVLYADTNGNGFYDATDTQISFAPYEGATFRGCNGTHIVKGEAKPTSLNGILKMANGDYERCYYWFGDVIDPTESGDMADFHFTDNLGNIIEDSNPNAT